MCMHFLCFVSSVHLVFEGSFCFSLVFCLSVSSEAHKKAEFGRMGGGEDLSGDKRGEIVNRIY